MSNVTVLLNETIDKVGKIGEIVDVKPGYARNYLIPNKLACIPTLGEVKRIQKKKELLQKQYEEEKKIAQDLIKKFEKLKPANSITFELKASESGKTFGSVTSKHVAEKIQSELGLELDRKDVHMKKNLTSIGEHTATIKLHPEVELELNIIINKIEDEKEAEAEAKLKEEND